MSHVDLTPDDAAALAERIIMVVEECTQLLESSNYHIELSLLHSMHQSPSQSLRMIVYGVDEHTVPPVALCPYNTVRSGGRECPQTVLNVEHVELQRSCGYTWNEVADALQVSRATIWRRLRESGLDVQRYSDISDDELNMIVGRLKMKIQTMGSRGFLGT